MAEAAAPRWSGAPAQIVFEDAHLRVMFKPGGSDMLLVTFGGAVDMASGTRFFADKLVGKYGINCLGFMAHAPNWYPSASLQAAARAVAFTLSAFPIRLGYGSSMGAYAAIKHSALLRLTHVMAYCPQWSIDPAECGTQESGYCDFFQPEMAGMAVRTADMHGRITIFYDPAHGFDAFHYRMLRAAAAGATHCRVQACLLPYVGHHLAPVLAGSDRTVSMFAACYHDDRAALVRITAAARRASAVRRRNLLSAAAVRHPVLTLRALAQLVRQGQASLPDGARCLIPLYGALHARGGAALAAELVALLLPTISALRRQLLAAADGVEAMPLMRTAHGTVLCYSALGGCLIHGEWPQLRANHPGARPVFVHDGRLAARVGGATRFCQSIDEHATELVAAPDPGCFKARPAGDGATCLAAADRFASAAPGGTVARGATEVLPWERFVVESCLAN